MAKLYNFFICLLNAALKVLALFSKKIKLMVQGHKEVFNKVDNIRFPEGNKIVWVHCASLGEFEQGRPVIETLKNQHEDISIVLTFFSPSGYEVRKEYPLADLVCYLPVDSPRNAKRFVRAIKPDIAIFVKYEYWYNFLHELKNFGAMTYVISAIFRPNMRFFKKYGGSFFRKMLHLIDHFFVQNQESVELLTSINISENRITIAGDTRFDRVASITQNIKKLPIVEQFSRGKRVMVCGSTWMPDIDVILPVMKQNPDVSFIIAPHVINNDEIKKIIEFSGRNTIRYSENKSNPEATLLIVDCIGLLSTVYSYGNFAYIGGGFGAGIHNILEAATWGLPVIFGPKYHKFLEAKELIELGAAFSVQNTEEMKQAFEIVTKNEEKLSKIASEYVKDKTGATDLIVNSIFKSSAHSKNN